MLNRPVEALHTLWSLLSPSSNQLEAAQSRFLKEFIYTFNQVNACGNGNAELPELSLPIFDRRQAKVMLGTPVRRTDGRFSPPLYKNLF